MHARELRLAGEPDEVWDEAVRHFDDRQLGGIVLEIAAINARNRIKATTRQISGPVGQPADRRRLAGERARGLTGS